MKNLQRISCCVLLMLLAAQGIEAKEGFGVMKKLVTLQRINPPEVLIRGARISVAGKGQGQEEKNIAEQIATQLGSELIQHDSRLSLGDPKPQTAIEVNVLRNDFETKWENRRGTKLEPAGKDSKGKMQYREVEVTLRYQVVNHRFAASYTVQDLTAKKTIFADSIDLNYHDDFQEGRNAPTEADRIAQAVQQTVGQVVYKLTPTAEALQVLVPKGSFEDVINLAEAGLWSRYSEAIEGRPALANPQEEAYRQYALGVSYEAMGYGADDTETTLRYLEQAAQHYNSALSMNPKEDFFSKPYGGSVLGAVGRGSLNVLRGMGGQAPIDASRRQAAAPIERVQTAMKKYQTLTSQNEARSGAAASGAKGLSGSEGAAHGMTNGDVIAMIKAGVPEEVVLNSIDGAEDCSFDTSPNGLIELAKAKVSKGILKRLQAKTCG